MQCNKLHNKTILVIEDSQICMALIRAFLAGTGAVLLAAQYGEDGLQKFAENEVDLVLTDLRLPDIEGLHLIRKMKKSRPDIPVIVQTASTIDYSEADCREAGCDNYITKPYSRKQFLDIVKETIGIHLPHLRTLPQVMTGRHQLRSSLSNPSEEYC